ncbi:hypothetical protein LZ30DRAFT_827262 [Colletotrichum cereale]|nr:hypothetical protein LZ30DRAFT_827262 [Colletotrichum cereale]
MAAIVFVWPVGWFFLSALFFFLGLRQTSRRPRTVLAALHVLAVAASLGASGEALRKLPLLAVPFVIGVTAHTTSILLLDEGTSTAGLSLSAQLKATTLLCFAPDKRTVLPSPWTSPELAYSDYVLRAITSTHWIWITYCSLTTMHHLSAALFVSVLNWESPSNWAGPPLFGSVWDAYTLRRFWGVFWHRLHIVPFSAYTPPLPKALRALWVFLLSAAGHAMVNWVMYHRAHAASEFCFFVLNWALCLCEHVLGVDGGRMAGRLASKPPSTTRRIAGLFFVWLFFLCTVPAWQYPGVYDRS